MIERSYSASLSQSQGRAGFSIIFRHPARRDAVGKPGLRVRRGLGTRDRVEAERLRDELNEILENPKYHTPAARADAERRFDSRVVEIFYDKMIPEPVNFARVRERAIPLPTHEHDGFRQVLLLGTTGAGKTTLVRQLIGTNPGTERFPSTSTARTTVHDIEIVLDDGPWRAIVTFMSSDELREYLNECISAAVLAAWRGERRDQVLRRLLLHVNQRHRFNYILGNGPQPVGSDFDEEDEDEEQLTASSLFGGEDLDNVDLDATNRILEQSLDRLCDLARAVGAQLKSNIESSDQSDDRRVFDEVFEDELDNLLRDEETVHEVADALMDEIEKRFDLLSGSAQTKTSRTKQGWPVAWEGCWDPDDRDGFLSAVSRFSKQLRAALRATAHAPCERHARRRIVPPVLDRRTPAAVGTARRRGTGAHPEVFRCGFYIGQ